jgi:hypothetical protein
MLHPSLVVLIVLIVVVREEFPWRIGYLHAIKHILARFGILTEVRILHGLLRRDSLVGIHHQKPTQQLKGRGV